MKSHFKMKPLFFFLILADLILLPGNDILLSQNKANVISIQNYQFIGNQALAEETIREQLSLAQPTFFSPTIIQNKAIQLCELYRGQGYYFCTVDSAIVRIDSTRQEASVDFYINEGPHVVTDSFQWNGLNEFERKKWSEQFNLRPGKTFNADAITEEIERGIEYFENSGFPLCQIRIDSLRFRPDNGQQQAVSLVLHVNPGAKITIDEMTVRGNRITRENVILRETRIKPGEIYQHNRIEKIPDRLRRLRFLKAVELPQLYFKEDGRAGLLIPIQEGNANQFDGVVGYTPGTATQKGYFTGLLNLSLGNLLGTGRKITAYWQKKSRQSQSLSFSYLEPWIAGFPVHGGFQFQQLIQDTTYLQRDLTLETQVPLTEHFTAFLKLTRQTVLPDSIGMVWFNIPKSSSNNLTIGLAYDTRDDLLNPRHGIFYNTSFEYRSKKNSLIAGFQLDVDDQQRLNQKKIEIDLEFYWSIFKNQVLTTNLHGRQLTSVEKYIPIPEQFRLGGTQTLRGYREEQFRGSRVAWANLEYRYLLSRRSRVFLFSDLGYFSRTDREAGFIQAFKVGYGFGIRLETGLGIMGIDYGLGEGSGLLGGLLHVGLINEF